jgi:hypothetical protein
MMRSDTGRRDARPAHLLVLDVYFPWASRILAWIFAMPAIQRS